MAKHLIPDYWKLSVKTTDDIVFLGKENIAEMIAYWSNALDSAKNVFKRNKQLIALLKNKTAKKITKLAEKFENPSFPQIGSRPDSWVGEQEPLDVASITRERGDTTFNVCGWCKYVSSGTCRYNYTISGTCEFEFAAGFPNKERKFNSPCFLKSSPDSTFKRITEGIEKQNASKLKRQQDIENNIKELKTLMKKSGSKPALSSHRKYDWFNVKEDVVCHVVNLENKIIKNAFVHAKVVPGYRHHDGCVSTAAEMKIHNGENLNGHGLSYGTSRPEVMLKWEFDYLRKNPDFAKMWANSAIENGIKGFSPTRFLADLKAAK